MMFLVLKWTLLPILVVIVVMVITSLFDGKGGETQEVLVRTGPALARLTDAELLLIRDEMVRSLRRQGKESTALVFEDYSMVAFRYYLTHR